MNSFKQVGWKQRRLEMLSLSTRQCHVAASLIRIANTITEMNYVACKDVAVACNRSAERLTFEVMARGVAIDLGDRLNK